MRPETEDKIMSAAMIVFMLGAAMTFLGLGLLAIGIAIAEFRSAATGGDSVYPHARGTRRLASDRKRDRGNNEIEDHGNGP